MARARAGWLVGRGLWLVGGGEQFESSSQQCSWLLNELGDLSGSLIYCTAVSLEHILGGGWVNGPLKHAPGGVKTRKDPKLLKGIGRKTGADRQTFFLSHSPRLYFKREEPALKARPPPPHTSDVTKQTQTDC